MTTTTAVPVKPKRGFKAAWFAIFGAICALCDTTENAAEAVNAAALWARQEAEALAAEAQLIRLASLEEKRALIAAGGTKALES